MITILGPTASGKTELAAYTAHHINGEIISADSRQVYRGMDLGTGKDYNDYTVKDTPVPYYLIDIREPGEEYNVYNFINDFFIAHRKITDQGKIPVLCGGTGFYIESVLKQYRLEEVPINSGFRFELTQKTTPQLVSILSEYKLPHNTTDTKNRDRLIRAIEIQQYYKTHPEEVNRETIQSVNFGISFERDIIRQRIKKRLAERLENGMIDEVKSLINRGVSIDKLMYYGLEYKYVALFLTGSLSFDNMSDQLYFAICQFSKRQMTWFRRMEKNGILIHWIDGKLSKDEKLCIILEHVK